MALLIGVSEYGEGLPPLSAAPNDVAAIQRILESPNMAGFDQVTPLINPALVDMQRAIKELFNQCKKDDLLLLYFSGHGITDDNNHLYLANRVTSKEYFDATAVPARFIQQQSMYCYTRRQVIILDCCYSGAFAEGWRAKSAGLDLKQELGAEGRAVLTSSTATQTSFQQEEAALSLYTQYLVQGVETGAADKDKDGKIHIQELHDYAKTKVQEVKPTMKPEILLDKEGFNILLSRAPVNDRPLEFRRLVEEAVYQGEISTYRREVLGIKQQELGLSKEAAEKIIASVLEPFRRRQVNLEKFKTALQEEVNRQYPLDPGLEKDLWDWQREVLGLADEDVAEIWRQVTAEKAEEYEYTEKLDRYQQALIKAISAGYPLSQAMQQELRRWRQTWGLKDEDIARVEGPVLEQAEARRQVELKQREAERLKQKEAENLLLQEEERQKQQEEERRRQEEENQRRRRQAAGRVRQSGSDPPLKTFEFDVVRLDDRGKEVSRNRRQAQYFSVDLGNGVDLQMVAIPGGAFLMGSPEGEGEDRERPQHSVTVNPFYMGRYPVTQTQWRAVVAMPQVNLGLEPDPSNYKGDNRSVEQVSWYEAAEFCHRLAGHTGLDYRLPSEAEWEYACRAGTTTKFHFGKTITRKFVNCEYIFGASLIQMLTVGASTEVNRFKVANAFGLADMHGNVWEWCTDHWHKNYQGAPSDGSAWLSSDDEALRLRRGGSWDFVPAWCRAASRYWDAPASRSYNVGFRVVWAAS